jgi:hypothetical protein
LYILTKNIPRRIGCLIEELVIPFGIST